MASPTMFTIPAVKNLKIRFRKAITFLVGENGSGKSTCYPLSHPAEFFLLDENGVKLVDYEETEHYRVTKSFLDNPARYFKVLFGK